MLIFSPANTYISATVTLSDERNLNAKPVVKYLQLRKILNATKGFEILLLLAVFSRKEAKNN